MKAKRRAVTSSPRVAEQKYPAPAKRPATPMGRGASVVVSGPSNGRAVAAAPVAADTVDLSVDLGRGLVLPNPILVASGTFGYGVEYGDVVDVDRLGGICCKGTTLKARIGNPTPRVTETPGGMLNSIGLQNPGVDAVIDKYGETWTTWKTPVIVKVAGSRCTTTSRSPGGWTACRASPGSSSTSRAPTSARAGSSSRSTRARRAR